MKTSLAERKRVRTEVLREGRELLKDMLRKPSQFPKWRQQPAPHKSEP